MKTLWKRHKNKSIFTRLTRHNLYTVTRLIEKEEERKAYPTKKPYLRTLEPLKEQIIEWAAEGLTGVGICEELQKQKGCHDCHIYLAL